MYSETISAAEGTHAAEVIASFIKTLLIFKSDIRYKTFFKLFI